ncbi:MAG: hypothetical protein ACYC4R_01880 [Anaerolineae bacterium]
MPSRRQFLRAVIPGLFVLSGGVTYAGYRLSGCPLSSEGVCQGPCDAEIDGNGDLLCDRIAALVTAPSGVSQDAEQVGAPEEEDASVADAATATPEATGADAGEGQVEAVEPVPPASSSARIEVSCPKGLTYDPYPGRCRLYVDEDGDGYCDRSVPQNS